MNATAPWWPKNAPVAQQTIGGLTTYEIRTLSKFAVAEIEGGSPDAEALADFLGKLNGELDERAKILAAVRPYGAPLAGRR